METTELERESSQKPAKLSRPQLGEFLVQEGLVDRPSVEAALTRQKASGGRLGDILQAQLGIRTLDYYRALAKFYSLPFIDLTKEKIDASLLKDVDRSFYSDSLVIPVSRDDGVFTVATADPSEIAFARIRRRWGSQSKIVVTSKFDVFWTLQSHFDEKFTHEIVSELYEKDPEKSALKTFTRAQNLVALAIFAVFVAVLYIHHPTGSVLVNCVLTVSVTVVLIYKCYLAFVGFSIPPPQKIDKVDIDEQSLPVYTILVPMYHESRVTIEHLSKNLQKLDYPPHKLDIKLVVEADDDDTINIIKSLHLPSQFEIVRVPPSEPRTKPKACNYALKFARGEFVTIYDAEDQPEPQQLKLAIQAFRNSGDKLACVQCALNYYNSRENWVTRMFTMEYTFWFDLMLPAMSKLRLPIPLGGTSNHFRTSFLKEMVAWDPFNVTEDADLGIRMMRLGYESKVVASTTYEEATSRVIPWIKQRTRWIKGYMQTYLVHMRHPRLLYKEFGPKNYLAFQLFVGGTVFSNLANLVLVAVFLATLVFGAKATSVLFPSPILEIALFNFVAGNLMLLALNLMAVWRRRLYDLIPLVATVPFYWFLGTIASYRALYQLFFKPSYWDKTQHGVSTYFDASTDSDNK